MRDFRDAKAMMAHALREALKTKAVETTHHGCLELVAKAFGYENRNILSAQITAAQPRSADERTLSSRTGGLTPPKTLYCTFCGKSHDLSKLIGARPCTCAMSASNWARVWSATMCLFGKVLELMHAAEESGSDPHQAAIDHLRGRSAQAVASYVEQCRGFVEHNCQIFHLRPPKACDA